MFNVEGSELIFLLLVALVVLGPEKLPDAVRKFGRMYAQFKKAADGFQGEFRQVLEEPTRELRSTSDALRNAMRFDLEPSPGPTTEPSRPNVSSVPQTPPADRGPELDFGQLGSSAAAGTPAEADSGDDGTAS